MFGTYQRMRVHASATTREVIKAAHGRLNPEARFSREQRKARHAFIREMLAYHERARKLWRRAA